MNNDGDVTTADRDAAARRSSPRSVADVTRRGSAACVNDGACRVADASELARAVDGLAPAARAGLSRPRFADRPERALVRPEPAARGRHHHGEGGLGRDARPEARPVRGVRHHHLRRRAVGPDPYTFFHAPTSWSTASRSTDVGIRKKGFFGSLSDHEAVAEARLRRVRVGPAPRGPRAHDPEQLRCRIRPTSSSVWATRSWPRPACPRRAATSRTYACTSPTRALPTSTAVDSLYVNVESIKEPFLGRVFGDADRPAVRGHALGLLAEGHVRRRRATSPGATRSSRRTTRRPRTRPRSTHSPPR